MALVRLLYFVQLTTTLMYALCTYQVYVMILLTLSLPDGQVQEDSPTSKHHTRQHPYLASAELHARFVQCHYHGVAS